MKLKKIILNVILNIINAIVHLFPIKNDQVTFVSLESNKLEQDLLQIYEEIKDEYRVKTVLIKFNKNTWKSHFLYMINTMKQIWHINQSAVVIINDNNYVVSNFKRSGVTVIQVWHATGAIKKFGNCLPREYVIDKYDYIIANHPCWIKPYSEAFGVKEAQVKVLGMPRVDKLFDESYKKEAIRIFEKKYPESRGKKLILYAPTFRGNIYQGFATMDLDGIALVEALGDEYILIYKYHPLLRETKITKHKQCINASREETYDLFLVSDMLISDYSSIIFDYALLEKPMVFFAPDLEAYQSSVGHFVDYSTMPGAICKTTECVIEKVTKLFNGSDKEKTESKDQVKDFADSYFTFQDGKNTQRVVGLIANHAVKKMP